MMAALPSSRVIGVLSRPLRSQNTPKALPQAGSRDQACLILAALSSSKMMTALPSCPCNRVDHGSAAKILILQLFRSCYSLFNGVVFVWVLNIPHVINFFFC